VRVQLLADGRLAGRSLSNSWWSPVGTHGSFPRDSVEPVLILADEEDHPEVGWMKGRAVAVDELENMMALQLSSVELQGGVELKGGTEFWGQEFVCLGKLKVRPRITLCTTLQPRTFIIR
jgi:hypothetical protein